MLNENALARGKSAQNVTPVDAMADKDARRLRDEGVDGDMVDDSERSGVTKCRRLNCLGQRVSCRVGFLAGSSVLPVEPVQISQNNR